MRGPCMCGDTECPSCGESQGTLPSSGKEQYGSWIMRFHDWHCGLWYTIGDWSCTVTYFVPDKLWWLGYPFACLYQFAMRRSVAINDKHGLDWWGGEEIYDDEPITEDHS